MAVVTISLQGTIDGSSQTVSRAATIDDAALPFFFEAYRAAYGQVPDTANDPDGSKNLMRDMTDSETFAKYAGGIADGSVSNVQNYLKGKAQAAAAAAVPTISVTPQS